MSLRDALKAAVSDGVACCTPYAMQPATSGSRYATSHATGVQPPAANPRKCGPERATGHATGVQLDSCIATEIETPKVASLHLATELAAAINRACAARGDDEANRIALLAECAEVSPEDQADLLAHFTLVAIQYETINRGSL